MRSRIFTAEVYFLIAIEIRKLELKFNKSIYVEMCILNISKVCLYKFHHDYMLPL